MRSLRDVRKKRGLTQRELEKLVDVPYSWLSILENGLATPNLETRHKIEVVLGKIDWIETGSLKINNTTSYVEATALVKKLVALTVLMSEKDKNAIRKLIHKYFNN